MDHKLKLGVAQGVVTPKIGCLLYGYSSLPHATGIHDDLHVTVFAFSQGETKALLISAEVCVLRTDIANALRQDMEMMFGVPKGHIMIVCTHTHSGPAVAGMYSAWGDFDHEYYQGIFRPALLDAVKRALEIMEPVTVGSAIGKSQVGINRRELTLEDKVILGENEWGPYNPNMTVISFKKESGERMASLVAYGAHGTSAGASTLITRDWSGEMLDALEAHSGAVTAFFQGTEGDVGPRKIQSLPYACIDQTEALGKIAAADAIRIFDTITEYKQVSLGVREEQLQIPVLPRMPYEEVCRRCAEVTDVTKLGNMQRVEHDFNLWVKASYEEGYEEKDFYELPQSVLSLGDIVFTGVTYELFSEIGMRIDKAFPDKNVISLSCTNGQDGYFPTRSQALLGGYEIIIFKNRLIQRLVDNADFYYIKETIRNINELEGQEER